ncbi:MAG: Putative leader peptide [Shouchella clausii]|uniref:Putative leader peptide n=1 Tax=Shouchella clausii TaxID=79880 RepID=Q6XFQ8_SHOCL|nr:putative leader peptide [Shouchella clausii]
MHFIRLRFLVLNK